MGVIKTVYEEIMSFPISMLAGEVDESLKGLIKILEDVKKASGEYDKLYMVPTVSGTSSTARVIPKRGSVPDMVLEPTRFCNGLAMQLMKHFSDYETQAGHVAEEIVIVGAKQVEMEDSDRTPEEDDIAKERMARILEQALSEMTDEEIQKALAKSKAKAKDSKVRRVSNVPEDFDIEY